MDKYKDITALFNSYRNEERAISMKHYMRDQFDFYGIAAPIRRALYKDFLKKERREGKIDWSFIDCCFRDSYRELQYLACDYLLFLNDYLTYSDIPRIKEYITTKPWWDTIDCLCKAVGNIAARDERAKRLMAEWSREDNIWVRRTAIEHQLLYRDKTDRALLAEIILNNTNSNEFFINKAIGWALREYSKTDKEWVRSFIDAHKAELSSLTIREAVRYLH